MIVGMLIKIQIFMYTFIFRHSISCIVSAKTSGYDDQFLNEVLQCQKQLNLPGVDCTFWNNYLQVIGIQELVMVKETASAWILLVASYGAELMGAVFMELLQWTDHFVGLNIQIVV